jgi:hypothetical protein
VILNAAARAVVRADGIRVLRPGLFSVYVGGGQPLVDPKFHTSNILIAELSVEGAESRVDRCVTHDV